MWHGNWFGFWQSPPGADSTIPSVEDFIDSCWNPPDKAQLIAYLAQSPFVVGAALGGEQCLLCSVECSVSSFCSDGIWLWPDDLPHYVECHSVVLPDRFVEHIRGCNYIAPSEVTKPIEELPWPP
jgi:hypothetical protein